MNVRAIIMLPEGRTKKARYFNAGRNLGFLRLLRNQCFEMSEDGRSRN
jgi:hypothetical protein